jgi:hypothetical protein
MIFLQILRQNPDIPPSEVYSRIEAYCCDRFVGQDEQEISKKIAGEINMYWFSVMKTILKCKGMDIHQLTKTLRKTHRCIIKDNEKIKEEDMPGVPVREL